MKRLGRILGWGRGESKGVGGEGPSCRLASAQGAVRERMVGRLTQALLLLLAAALAIQVQLSQCFKSRLFDSLSICLVNWPSSNFVQQKKFVKITVRLGFVSLVSYLKILRVVAPFFASECLIFVTHPTL